MKLHRFIGDFIFDDSTLSIIDPEIVNQLKNVLRLKIGEELILCDGKGYEISASIQSIDRKEIIVELGKMIKNKNEIKHQVNLFCAILKKENFELVAQKATEIGITRIVPVISKRTIKIKVDPVRIKKIIKEASEQSGRGVLPELHEQMNFAEAIEYAKTLGESIIFDGSGYPISDTRSTPHVSCIFIGPEGGWTENELTLAKENNFHIKNLGPLTLRAETAAIVACFLSTR